MIFYNRVLTGILQDFSRAFCVLINIFLVFLLYDTLKMVTRVTETRRCNEQIYIAEHLNICAFAGVCKRIGLP